MNEQKQLKSIMICHGREFALHVLRQIGYSQDAALKLLNENRVWQKENADAKLKQIKKGCA